MSNSFPNGTDLSLGRQSPVIDYTSADFDSINADLTTYAQTNFSDRWTDFNTDQFAVVFKELVAYLGDLLCYQVNSTLREAFAATVIRRQNLQNIGKEYGYQLPGAIPATITLTATLDPAGAYPATIAQTDLYSNGASGSSLVTFFPTNPIVVPSYPAGGLLIIPATQGQYYSAVLIGVSDGTPNQRWQFPQQNIYGPSVTVIVGAQTWTPVSNLTTSLSTDTVYKLIQTDDGNAFAVFGDGVFGAIPASSSSITANFNVGGGTGGNIQTFGVITTKAAANPVILSITNSSTGSGGSPPQTVAAGRGAIPASLSTLQRGCTETDYENLATLQPGVAAARAAPGIPSGSRIIRVWIAPVGGGLPTPQLLTAVSRSFKLTKFINNRIQLFPPVYMQVLLNVLLHVNSSFRASDVNQVVRQGIINTDETGLLDFPQLAFEGIVKDPNGDTELLLTQTALQAYFNSLKIYGLDRAEIQQLSIQPTPRVSVVGNTGNGTVTNITLTSRQRRRQYSIRLISAAQFSVYEYIVGYVQNLTDVTLTDGDKTFENEDLVNGGLNYILIPNSDSIGSTLTTVSAAGTDITTLSGTTSLFSLTEADNQYFLYNPIPVIGLVDGAPFVSSDGNVSFQVVSGMQGFVAGDSFILDVYPIISDIRLEKDEYPELLLSNFVTRTSGGSQV